MPENKSANTGAEPKVTVEPKGELYKITVSARVSCSEQYTVAEGAVTLEVENVAKKDLATKVDGLSAYVVNKANAISMQAATEVKKRIEAEQNAKLEKAKAEAEAKAAEEALMPHTKEEAKAVVVPAGTFDNEADTTLSKLSLDDLETLASSSERTPLTVGARLILGRTDATPVSKPASTGKYEYKTFKSLIRNGNHTVLDMTKRELEFAKKLKNQGLKNDVLADAHKALELGEEVQFTEADLQ